MLQAWRWFGPPDSVSLNDIRQAGARGVVSALHHIANGTVWPLAEIEQRKALIADCQGTHWPLHWAVVESIPIHEEIKTGGPNRDLYIGRWIETMRNLAEAGLHTICYNFMPVLDWTRTNLAHPMPDGSEALRFVGKEIALFDCLILGRPGAWAAYPASWRAVVEAMHLQMSEAQKATLQANILAGLPGAEEAWSLPAFRQKLEAYANINAQQLRANLVYFLAQVCPIAEGLGVVLTLHPDDPPRPIFGLPRIASTATDFEFIFDAVPSGANGLCFCTGSLGARADNDMPAMLARFAARVHFLHLRNVQIEDHEVPETFHEADHLDGQADMVQIIRLVLAEEARRGSPIPMRPDHGHRMLSDLQAKANPGYTAIGRLRGLAELRGVERALGGEYYPITT